MSTEEPLPTNPHGYLCRKCKTRIAEDYYLDLSKLDSDEFVRAQESGQDFTLSFMWLCNACGTEFQRRANGEQDEFDRGIIRY